MNPRSGRLSDLVSFGIVAPSESGHNAWRFNEVAVQRAKQALRLQRDLGLEGQGLALSLDLLDEIVRLRRLIARLGA